MIDRHPAICAVPGGVLSGGRADEHGRLPGFLLPSDDIDRTTQKDVNQCR